MQFLLFINVGTDCKSALSDFLMGEAENQNIFKDPVMFKRMADIERLPEKDKQCLLLTVDNFIKATKLNSL